MVMHEENTGVVQNVQHFLPKMLDEPGCFNFTFKYEGTDIVDIKEEHLEKETLATGNS
ncbi:hypothetical protein GCM10009001_08550 [Virgibacillus siamensis]|uniref:Uncharacterized protein n=2 Tax=Virgibacillus siamensis TaxID=480071 RepID=A0ABN1FNV7_9BACI